MTFEFNADYMTSSSGSAPYSAFVGFHSLPSRC